MHSSEIKKIYSIVFHVILIILTCQTALGQSTKIASKSVYFELAGSGGIGSFNYEKQFSETDYRELTWRAGLSLAPIDYNNGIGIVIPVMVNALIGKHAHKFETGLGQGITITTRGSFFALTTVAIGYRFQPESSKWFYRVTYTPLISYLVDFQIQQWAGLSIGYKLN